MHKKYRSIQVSMHTFDARLPLVGNAQYLEIDVDAFSKMDEQEFKEKVLETAEKFWVQMQKGGIHKNSTFEIKEEIK